jgi:hypothetical protein
MKHFITNTADEFDTAIQELAGAEKPLLSTDPIPATFSKHIESMTGLTIEAFDKGPQESGLNASRWTLGWKFYRSGECIGSISIPFLEIKTKRFWSQSANPQKGN